jgi:hypothetical protein
MSGHWMLFYGAAASIIEAARRRTSTPPPPYPTPPVFKPRLASFSKTSLPKPSPTLQYGRSAPFAPPIWLHSTLILMSRLFGWLGFPVLIAFVLMPHAPPELRPLGIVLIIASAIFGVTIPALFIQRALAARCPRCGGRAMCRSTNPVRYECLDCKEELKHL